MMSMNFGTLPLPSLRFRHIYSLLLIVCALLLSSASTASAGNVVLDAAQAGDASTGSQAVKTCVTIIPLSPANFEPLAMEFKQAGEGAHCYEITLRADQYLHAVIDQRGVDVVVVLIGPDGATKGDALARVDRPNRHFGPESITWVAQSSGTYTLQVYPLIHTEVGKYSLTELQVREAQPADEQRVKAERLMSEAEQLRASGNELRTPQERNSLAEGLKRFSEARDIFNEMKPNKLSEDINYEAALAYYGVGLCSNKMGDVATASTQFLAALAKLNGVTYPAAKYMEVSVSTNLAYCLLRLGQAEKALELFASTVEACVALNDQRGLAASLSGVAEAQTALGRYDEAERTFADALKHRGSNTRGISITLMGMGRLQGQSGRHDRAIKSFLEARRLIQQRGDNEAYVLSNLGWMYAQQCDYQNAVKTLKQAVELARDSDPTTEGVSLYHLALLKRQWGELPVAYTYVNRALELLESVNQNRGSLDLRTRYFASIREIYELAINTCMEMDRYRPAQGYAITAAQTSERMHSQELSTLLRETQEQYYAPGLPYPTQDVSLSLGRQTQAGVKPRTGEPARFTLEELRQELDPDTLLIEYAITPTESYIWAVSRTTFHSFALHTTRLNEVAQDVINMFIKEPALMSKFEARVETLSEMLLPDPIPALLSQYKKLLIVPDGVLHNVPFAGLTLARRQYEPLLVRHEIIYLPSLTTVARARQGADDHRPAYNRIAVVADPVITRSDKRLLKTPRCEPARHVEWGTRWSSTARPVACSTVMGSTAGLRQLPSSAREANIIKGIYPQASIKSGFDASLQAVQSGDLSNYQIVHFASHTAMRQYGNSEMGVVLSHFGQDGQARDGFLGVSEILDLHLPADLVVLSACQTGVGNELAGEWIEGLSAALIEVGTRRVVVSQWPVQGRITSDLIKRFYSLLKNQKTAPESLRKAQESMWREGKYAPADYLGFVMYGEWR